MSSATSRTDEQRQFLDLHGLEAELQPMAGDASARHYYRLRGTSEPLLLMDMGGLATTPFLRIAGHLDRLGFRVPRIHAADVDRGLVLLEDLGDATFTRLLADGADDLTLYRLAIDQLIRLHRMPESVAIEAPFYDEAILLEEAGRLLLWLFPVLHGRPASTEEHETYQQVWRDILHGLPPPAISLVLVDFHVDNLMQLEDGHCALLDFQDARIGAAAYDVVSLLEDARRDVPPAVAESVYARYLASRPQVEHESFARWYAVLGAQRHCKVAGLFLRLCLRDGKSSYLRHIPRVLGLPERHLDQPDLAPLRHWLDTHLPQRQSLPAFDPTELRTELDRLN